MNLNNITTALKTGITIYQYEQWQNTGSVNLMQRNLIYFPRFSLRQISITQILWINPLSNSLLLLLQNSISKNITNG